MLSIGSIALRDSLALIAPVYVFCARHLRENVRAQRSNTYELVILKGNRGGKVNRLEKFSARVYAGVRECKPVYLLLVRYLIISG